MSAKPLYLTWSGVVELWPSVADLAEDLAVSPRLVHKWRERDSIPAERLLAIWQAAQRRGIPLTAERLLFVAAATDRADTGRAPSPAGDGTPVPA